MSGWYFIPWNFQYLISACAAILLTIYVVRGDYRHVTYRCFLFFGLSLALSQIFLFLYRSAPTADLSVVFRRVDESFILLIMPFMLMALLSLLDKKKKVRLLVALAPALIVVAFMFVGVPLYMVWSDIGWVTRTTSLYYPVLAYSTFTAYLIAVIIAGTIFIREVDIFRTTQKKYKLILLSITILIASILATNSIMQVFPNFTPFGGITVTIVCAIMAYAIHLKSRIKFVVGESKEIPIPIS